jgi:predicted Zn-dependent peptidase
VVVVRASRAAPLFAATLLVGVGSRDERPEESGASALLGRALLKGTARRSALEVARAAEDAGGALESAADQEYTELRVRGLARHWRALLELLREVASEPRLEPGEVERERTVLLARIRELDDEPFQVASRLLARALFGPSGYGLPPSGTRESVARLTADGLRRHLEERFRRAPRVLGVAGDVPEEDVAAEAGALFGARPPGPAGGAPDAPGDPAPGGGPEGPVRVAEVRPTQQSQVLLGYAAPPIGHPDHVALKVANTLLGGGMSSRLFRRLRDRDGLAYAVGSLYPTRRGRGRLVAHIGTAPRQAAAAEAAMRAVVEGVATEPLPEEELALARTSLAGAFLLDLRTSARRSFLLALYELAGVGAAWIERYPALAAAVGPAEVRRVAARWLAAPAVVTVGPERGEAGA